MLGLTRHITPVSVIAVTILLTAITAWWLASRGVVESEPAAIGTPQPSAIAKEESASTPLDQPTSVPTAEVATNPTPPPAPTLVTVPTPTLEAVRLEHPRLPTNSWQSLASPESTSAKGPQSERLGPNKGTVYTYKDGDRIIRVVLQDDMVVQETGAITSDDVVIVRGATNSIVRRQAKHGEQPLPVFRLESSGGLMTLPGGVLLVLDADWDQSKVDEFFMGNNIPTDRISELEYLPNGFLIETDPGFASLELANQIAAQQGVILSSPDWWSEVEAK